LNRFLELNYFRIWTFFEFEQIPNWNNLMLNNFKIEQF
jgi:hypothetical protein